MNRRTACNAEKMKMNDPQVQNEQIFSLGKVQKQERNGKKKMSRVTDGGQRECDDSGVCGVAQEERGGDR